MLKHFEEYGKWVEITGFPNVAIKDPKEFSKALGTKLCGDCEIQLFDADLVATWEHLYFAVLNALMNIENKRGISKSLAMEVMLYASAQRQIRKALKLVGLTPASKNVAVVVICDKAELVKAGAKVTARFLGVEPDENVLALSQLKKQRIREVFDVSDAELEPISTGESGDQALVDAVVERVALLSTKL